MKQELPKHGFNFRTLSGMYVEKTSKYYYGKLIVQKATNGAILLM